MIHELHFLLDGYLYDKVEKLSKKEELKVSSMIVTILEKMLSNSTISDFFEGQNKDYKVIADLNDKRHNIRIQISEEFYLSIRQAKRRDNIFSMAQIIRRIIETFFMSYK